MPKTLESISRSDLKFWIPIIGIAVGGAIAFTSLKSQVEAMVSREQANKSQFMKVADDLEEIKFLTTEIYVNQSHIMRELGIE